MTFSEDFRRFFLGGLAALLPTLITVSLLIWIWSFLWESMGRHIIYAIKWLWLSLGGWWVVPAQPAGDIDRSFDFLPAWKVQVLGVGLAILLVYVVGLFVGNLIGRTMWRLAERALMKIPIVRAVYPAVKQVTDFLLGGRKQPFASSRVVACQPHASGIWSIGLVTGPGLKSLSDATGENMVTVFVPSSPTAFSGYVMVVPRESIVELPMTVEEAMRLLVTGGVIHPLLPPPGTADPAAVSIRGEQAAFRGQGPASDAAAPPNG